MADDPQVTDRRLRRQLLITRCELDRRELLGDIDAVRYRVHRRAESVGRIVPWILLAAPVAGVLAVRILRPRRVALGLLAARLAMAARPFWPVLAAFLGPRRPPH